MRVSHLVEYLLLDAVSLLIRMLPLRFLPRFAGCIVRLGSPLLQSRKRVALRNLRNAFPEKAESELERIARESFVSVTTAFLELLWFPRLTREQLSEKVAISNPDLIAEVNACGKGAICLTAHFGNWEMGAQAIINRLVIPTHVIVKTQSNKLVDKKINDLRMQFGGTIVPMGLSIREILRALQRGGAIILAADQTAPKESILIEFFGRAVPTFQGPAAFSLKSGALLILFMTVRQSDGRYNLLVEKVPSEDLKSSSEENVLELTRRQVKMTEDIIRAHPEQWMWMHKRWKHVPDRAGIAQ